MATEEKRKDEKPSRLKKYFGKKGGSTLTQIRRVAPSSLVDGQRADAGNGTGAQRPSRGTVFSFRKSKPKGQNGGNSDQAGGSDGTPPESEDLKKLDPWSRAYAKMRSDRSTKELVQIYEKILAYRIDPTKFNRQKPEDIQDPFNDLSVEARIERLSEMLQSVLEKYQEEKWWKTAAEGAEDVISKIGTGVGTALAAYPPAAFAWSGICLAVPILVRPITEEKKISDGMEYVLERMDWFISLSRAVMRRDWPDDHPFRFHRESTQNETIELFRHMLKFEMECACRAYDNDDHPIIHALLGAAKDMIQLSNWDKKIKDIKELDDKISKAINEYKVSVQVEYSAETAENTANLLVDVRQIRLLEEGAKKFADDERLTKLISRFGNTTYFDQMRLNPRRHPGTCRWFRAHEKYKDWLKSTQNDLLLVTAEPGCGKSVLSRCLIEQDLPSRRWPGSNAEPVVCYFFFKDNTIQSSLTNALGAIIHQLLVASEVAAQQFVQEISVMSDKMLEGRDTLWNLLERVATHETFKSRKIYCLFDALDECAPEDRAKLTGLLRDHLKLKKRIQFIITCRPYDNITDAFQESEWAKKPICLEGEGDKQKDELQKEIDIVFRYKIDDLVNSKRRSPVVATLINEKLLTKGAGQRTYLWVRLVFELLKTAQPPDLEAWENLLDDLPVGVPGAYDKLLSHVNPKYRDDVLTLLHIIYIAVQPLTLRQANIAVHIRGKYDVCSMKDLRLDDQSFRTWLRQECGFFITEYDGRLFFIHQTAREFLRGSNFTEENEVTAEEQGIISESSQPEGTAASTAKSKKAWRNSIKSDADAHFVMAECCIAAILVTGRDRKVQQSARLVEDTYCAKIKIQEYRNLSENVDTRRQYWYLGQTSVIQTYKKVGAEVNDFFSYCCEGIHWHHHFNDCGMDTSEDSGSDISLLAREALLAAHQSINDHPLRSVHTSVVLSGFGGFEDNVLGLLDTAKNRMKGQDIGQQLSRLLEQVKLATTLRCSPVSWGCVMGQPSLIRRCIGGNEAGDYRRLDMSSLRTCQHSEDLEILLSICVGCYQTGVHAGRRGGHMHAKSIRELLRYEEKRLQDDHGRKQYFRDLLWFVRLSILEKIGHDGISKGVFDIISLDEMMEKRGIGEEDRSKLDTRLQRIRLRGKDHDIFG